MDLRLRIPYLAGENSREKAAHLAGTINSRPMTTAVDVGGVLYDVEKAVAESDVVVVTVASTAFVLREVEASYDLANGHALTLKVGG